MQKGNQKRNCFGQLAAGGSASWMRVLSMLLVIAMVFTMNAPVTALAAAGDMETALEEPQDAPGDLQLSETEAQLSLEAGLPETDVEAFDAVEEVQEADAPNRFFLENMTENPDGDVSIEQAAGEEVLAEGNLGKNENIKYVCRKVTEFGGKTKIVLTVSGNDELAGKWDTSAFSGIKNLGFTEVVFEDCKLTGDADYLFYELDQVTSVDCSGLDTSGVTSMREWFYHCSGLTYVDLSGLSFESINEHRSLYCYDMLREAFDLQILKTPEKWGCEEWVSKNYLELPNPFVDGEENEYLKITPDIGDGSKTLTRKVTPLQPLQPEWVGDTGVIRWQMPEGVYNEEYQVRIYLKRDDEGYEMGSYTAGVYKEDYEDGYYYYDFSKYITEEKTNASFRVRVRPVSAYDGRGDEGLWSEFSKVMDRDVPADKLPTPSVSLSAIPLNIYVDNVDDVTIYIFYLCYRNDEGEEVSVRNFEMPKKRIRPYSDNYADFRWGDYKQTKVCFAPSNGNFMNMEEGKEYYWKVITYSDKVCDYSESEPGYSVSFNYTVTPQTDGSGKLTKPDHVAWDDNWKLTCVAYADTDWFDIQIAKDGEVIYDGNYYGGGLEVPYIVRMDAPDDYIMESGSYRFRVKACVHGGETGTESDWSDWSEARTYVDPGRKLGTTTPVWLSGEKEGYISFEPVEGAEKYGILCYLLDNDGNITNETYHKWCEDGKTEADFNEAISYWGGNCKLGAKVKAFSGNIDEAGHGEYGELSEVYTAGTGIYVEPAEAFEEPYDLSWDGFKPTWKIPESVQDAKVKYYLYQEGEEDYLNINSFDIVNGKPLYSQTDVYAPYYIMGSGDYYFTVQIVPNAGDTEHSASVIIRSEAKHYSKPSASMPVTTAKWSEEEPGVVTFDAVEGAPGYHVYLHMVPANKADSDDYADYITADGVYQKRLIFASSIENGVGKADFSNYLKNQGANYYYSVRVCTWSNDIAEKANAWGGYSKPYKYKELQKYTVSFNTLGHGSVKSATVNEGAKVARPADPSATGLKFGGWYRDKEYTSAWDFAVDTVDADTELFAKWTEVPVCTVSFNLLGHGKEIASVKVNKDEAVNAPAAPSEEGYEFGGWYKEEGCTNAWKFTDSVSADMILYAKWTKAERYTVTFDLQGHGEAVAAVSVNAGGKVAEPAKPAAEGFTFGGWFKEKECANAWNFAADTVSANMTLYAKWTEAEKAPVSYVVTFDLQGHGEAIASVSVNEGSEVAEPAKPSAEGFIFGGWFKEKACTTEWKFKGSVSADTVSANVTLYAKWTEEKKEDPVNTETTVTPEDKDDTTYAIDIRKDLKAEGAAIGDIKARTYDGKPYLPTVKVTASVGGKTVTLTEGADYRVLYKNNVNAGTGTVIVKGNGLYTGEITKDFTISKKPIGKLKVVTGGLSVNSTAAAPVYVYDGGTLLKAGVDYDVTKPDTSAKGSPKVTITAKAGSNYDGSRTAAIKVYDSAKVLGADNIMLKNPADVSLDYTGKALKPEVEVKFNGTPLDKKDYTVKYTNNKEAGTAFITVTGKRGYAGSAVLTFTIRPVAKAFDGAAPKDAIYSGKAQKPKMKVTVDGKTLKMGKDYVLLYSDNVHAGKGKVTVKGLGNYAGTASKIFEFTIKTQDIKKASVKGSRNQLEVSYAKKRLVEGTDYTAAYGAENKGKVEVTLTGKGDFTGTATKKVKAK